MGGRESSRFGIENFCGKSALSNSEKIALEWPKRRSIGKWNGIGGTLIALSLGVCDICEVKFSTWTLVGEAVLRFEAIDWKPDG